MGLVDGLFARLFGCGLKDVQKTVETLRPNAEADAQRGADYQAAALKQFGAIVSFYFGARYQVKGQAFQESLAATLARSPRVVRNIKAIRPLSAGSPGVADVGDDAKETPEALARSDNQAVADWAGD